MKKGIFWCVAAESAHPWLITVSVSCDAEGNPDTPAVFTSKAGMNFNHKAEWEKLDKSIRGGLPYNYYPRGRVEIWKGKEIPYRLQVRHFSLVGSNSEGNPVVRSGVVPR